MNDAEPIADLFPEVQPHCGNTDENWRFTTPVADAWLRSIARVERWDLDPAACHEAHLSEYYYTLERGENGLALPWFGRVGYNPPWDDIEPFVMRSWSAWRERRDKPLSVIAALLPLRTHMGWWKKWVAPFRDGRGAARPALAGDAEVVLEMHEAPVRFAYGGPGNPRGIDVAEPNFQSVGLVWRDLRAPPKRKRKLHLEDCPGCSYCEGSHP